MKVEKVIREYDEIYIAEDGTRWSSEQLCKDYEELLKDPFPIKSLKFFDSKGDPIDVFALGKIPKFSYLVITEDEIKYYHWLVVLTIIGEKDYNAYHSYNLPIFHGVYYNDWSNELNGNRGFNGWKRVGETIESLENKIKGYQDRIEFLKKIQGLN